jgi:hypothetical protein
MDPVSLPATIGAAGRSVASASSFLSRALSPVKFLLIGFVPKRTIIRLTSGQITAKEIESCISAFSGVSAAVNEDIQKRTKKVLASKGGLSATRQQQELEYIEKSRRYLTTVHQALTIGLSGDLSGGAIGTGTNGQWGSDRGAKTAESWFDLFREIAERRCEPWRRELLARAAALELQHENAISLKSLWNIAMLEADQFELFTMFLNSSVYIDGYPLSLLEDESLTVSIDSHDNKRNVQYSYIIGTLIEHGLVSNDSADIENVEPIEVRSKSNSMEVVFIAGKRKGRATTTQTPVLRLHGSRCTDLGLDLARLCEARLDEISDKNFELLESLLRPSKEVEMHFKKTKP